MHAHTKSKNKKKKTLFSLYLSIFTSSTSLSLDLIKLINNFVWGHVVVCVMVSVYMCTHMCVGQKTSSGVVPQVSSSFLSRQVSHCPGPGHVGYTSWPAGFLGSACLCFPSHHRWDYKHTLVFTRGQGLEPRSSPLHDKNFTN